MKIRIVKFGLVLLFSIPVLLLGNSKTDSLKSEYKLSKTVIEKAEILYALSEAYGFSQVDSSFYYAQQLLQFIQDNEDKVAPNYLDSLQKIKAKGNNNLGVLFYVMGNLKKGIEYLQKGISIQEGLNDSLGLIQSYGNIFQLYQESNDYKNSFDVIYKLTSIAEGLEKKSAIGTSYFSYGNLYIELSDYKNAEANFFKVLEIADEINDNTLKARALSQLGNINRMQSKDSMALEYFLKSYQIGEKLNIPSLTATVLSNIGSIYNNKNDIEKAKYYARKSMEIRLQNRLIKDLTYSYNNMSRLFYKINDKDSSYYYANLAYELAKKIKEEEVVSWSSHTLYNYFKEKKDLAKAIFYLEEHNSYSLKINDASSKKSLEKLLLKNEFETQQRADSITAANELMLNKAILGSKINNQKKVIYFIVCIALVLVLLSIFIYKNYRQKVKYSEKIELQSMLLETKNNEITDSIQYAKRLQNAILPSIQQFNKHFSDSFVIYEPKDIVAGDFYFLEKVENQLIFAAADSTGHGVPGAMVSVVCSNALNRAVNEYRLSDPADILEKVRHLVTKTFQKSENEVRDGMDVSICNLNLETFELQWSGANNPLWVLRKDSEDIEEIKADKQAIGFTENPMPFTHHTIQLSKGDRLYIFSDGYADQFGGQKGKKFKTSSMKKLIISMAKKTMTEQKEVISSTFINWKGNLEQVDDVCVIGVEI